MYVLCDVGGTKTRIVLANDEKMTSDPVIFKTPKEYSEAKQVIPQEILKLTGHEKIDAVVMGTAGMLNKDKSSLFKSPNLPDWNGKPLRRDLSTALETDIYLENDSSLVGLGEAVFGAGKGFKIVVYLTISTGVGGTRIVDGRIDERDYGFEPGYQLIPFDEKDILTETSSPEAPCDKICYLENLIGGANLQKHYGTPTEIKNEELMDNISKYLAYGLNNVLVFWSPDIIVLGGGLVLHNVVKIDKVKTYLQQVVKMYPELPQIVESGLGDVGGLYGGLAFVRNHLSKN